MKQCIPHNLGSKKAKELVSVALESYKKKFSEYCPSVSWLSDKKASISFQVNVVKLDGYLEVEDANIGFDLNVPFIFSAFKRQVVNAVENEITNCIKNAEASQIK